MKEFFDIVSNLGFPIGVSCYLLFRFEKKLDALEEAVRKMADQVDDNNKLLEGCKRRSK